MARANTRDAWRTLERVATVALLAVCPTAATFAQAPAPSGRFRPYLALEAPGVLPTAVAVGDVSGDGRKDVVLVGPGYPLSAVLVYRQGPSGALAPPVSYPTGYSRSVAIGDLNGDGRLDVVVGNVDSVGVLLQDRSGELLPMVEYPTPHSSGQLYLVKTGDIDGDNRQDVVAVEEAPLGSDVVVYLQDASGTLGVSGVYRFDGNGAAELELGDVNRDGRDDIVVRTGQYFSLPDLGILKQTPDGGLAMPVYYDLGGFASALAIGVGDVDGDSRKDVVLTYNDTFTGGGLAIFHQDSTGALGVPERIGCAEASPCGEMDAVEVGDVDGDGRQDLVAIAGSWGGLRTLRQDVTGRLVADGVEPLPYVTVYKPQGLALGDLNGDGLLDVAIADQNNGLVVLYQKTCDECVRDGGFEGGIPNPSWDEHSSTFGTPLCTLASCGNGGGSATPHSGAVWAWFGGVEDAGELGSLAQDVVLHPGPATLRFYLWNGASSGNKADYIRVLVDGLQVFAALEGGKTYTHGYTPVAVDLSTFADGGSHHLVFESHTDGPRLTNFSVDDVSLQNCIPPLAAVSVSDTLVTEGGPDTRATFAVWLQTPSPRTVSVRWSTADETAQAENDYVPASGTVVFQPGEQWATVSVDVLADRVAERRERFFVNLSDPVNAVVVRGQAVGVIADDDLEGLSIDDTAVAAPTADPSTATFNVTLAPPSDNTVSVDYATVDGSALAGRDYEAAAGTLIFPPGIATLTIPVTVLPNPQPEKSRAFQVELNGATGATVAWAIGTGTILAPGFHTLAPCRILDTRNPLDGPPLAAGATRVLTMTGRCGLPPTARAVVLNVVATGATSAGHLRLFRGGGDIPVASAVNFVSGQNRANNAVVPLSSVGQLSIYDGQATGTVHVVLDIAGYFTSQ